MVISQISGSRMKILETMILTPAEVLAHPVLNCAMGISKHSMAPTKRKVLRNTKKT